MSQRIMLALFILVIACKERESGNVTHAAVAPPEKPTAVKVLDEESAANLITQHLRTGDYAVLDISRIKPLFGLATLVEWDRCFPRTASADDRLMRLLVSKKLVAKTVVSTPTIPDLDGDYDFNGADGYQFTSWLLQRTTCPDFAGVDEMINPYGRKWAENFGVTWIDEQHVQVAYPELGRTRVYTVTYTDGLITLETPSPVALSDSHWKFRSKKPHVTVTARKFVYELSDTGKALLTRLDGTNSSWKLRTGRLKATNVSNLLLQGETNAAASFMWSLEPEDVFAKDMEDFVKPSGSGSAVFGKRPDGAWVVTDISLSKLN